MRVSWTIEVNKKYKEKKMEKRLSKIEKRMETLVGVLLKNGTIDVDTELSDKTYPAPKAWGTNKVLVQLIFHEMTYLQSLIEKLVEREEA